jgi:hypothetical protein
MTNDIEKYKQAAFHAIDQFDKEVAWKLLTLARNSCEDLDWPPPDPSYYTSTDQAINNLSVILKAITKRVVAARSNLKAPFVHVDDSSNTETNQDLRP